MVATSLRSQRAACDRSRSRNTNHLSLSHQPSHQHSAGLIALLYKARWDIEKAFDEFKNKLCETKAWASSATAKTQQARLLCLTHNLTTLMEEQISKRSGVINQAEFKRKAKIRSTNATAKTSSSSAEPITVQYAVERLTQRTVQFIRWLKNHLDLERYWGRSIARLNEVYTHL